VLQVLLINNFAFKKINRFAQKYLAETKKVKLLAVPGLTFPHPAPPRLHKKSRLTAGLTLIVLPTPPRQFLPGLSTVNLAPLPRPLQPLRRSGPASVNKAPGLVFWLGHTPPARRKV